MTTIGYGRVSTGHQDLGQQIAALQAAGCDPIFSEKISSCITERPELEAALAHLQPGDVLVISKLDRLGRTQVEVINRLNDLQQQGIHVKTLDKLIDTEALGKMAPLVVGLLTGLAEVERELIRERTVAAIEHRKITGQSIGGRPKTYSPEQLQQLKTLRDQGVSIAKAANSCGMAKRTAMRALNGK